MNKVLLCGRLTKDPDIRYSAGDNPISIARYSIAIDRNEKDKADFPNCIAFGKQAEFAEKYLSKGMKIIVEGRLQTGSYEKQDGTKVYTTDVIVDHHEFCEAKGSSNEKPAQASGDDFMSIPDGLDEELPFN